MSVNFEELDFRPTPMGVLSLRRRRLPATEIDIYEIKLGDEYLMSSRFTVAEIELARLGLAALLRADLDVVVGGLGLGYTAQAALENPARAIADRGRRVGRGHRMARAGAASARQATDRRSALPPGQWRLLCDVGFGRGLRSRQRRGAASMRCWWISITRRETCCIRATPRCTSARGLRRLAEHLNPGGVFALWSNDPPDAAFSAALAEVFATSDAHVVSFDNSFGDHDASNTVYIGVKAG